MTVPRALIITRNRSKQVRIPVALINSTITRLWHEITYEGWCAMKKETKPNQTSYNRYYRHFYIPQFFSSQAKSRYVFFFQFFSVVCRNSQVYNLSNSPFFVDDRKVWSSGPNLVIHLHLKIPEKCVRLILQGRFWVVNIIIYFLRVFPISVSWWFFFWSSSPLKSPGFFSVFWPIPIIQ